MNEMRKGATGLTGLRMARCAVRHAHHEEGGLIAGLICDVAECGSLQLSLFLMVSILSLSKGEPRTMALQSRLRNTGKCP
ncbi:hypothetical protein [Phyllobacterium calauticae]|jgi:hypothetical protein|uniref:hypothetical protein n=1 Tax=Phyllobacterium calauticae TaxID=2817027 RepID=UPI001CBE974E|nr:hypothetical protein [Phyllobacterium calauticae]MBZ3691210.1 hypothetical protein [Phyllobacterium calauticae]